MHTHTHATGPQPMLTSSKLYAACQQACAVNTFSDFAPLCLLNPLPSLCAPPPRCTRSSTFPDRHYTVIVRRLSHTHAHAPFLATQHAVRSKRDCKSHTHTHIRQATPRCTVHAARRYKELRHSTACQVASALYLPPFCTHRRRLLLFFTSPHLPSPDPHTHTHFTTQTRARTTTSSRAPDQNGGHSNYRCGVFQQGCLAVCLVGGHPARPALCFCAEASRPMLPTGCSDEGRDTFCGENGFTTSS